MRERAEDCKKGTFPLITTLFHGKEVVVQHYPVVVEHYPVVVHYYPMEGR